MIAYNQSNVCMLFAIFLIFSGKYYRSPNLWCRYFILGHTFMNWHCYPCLMYFVLVNELFILDLKSLTTTESIECISYYRLIVVECSTSKTICVFVLKKTRHEYSHLHCTVINLDGRVPLQICAHFNVHFRL